MIEYPYSGFLRKPILCYFLPKEHPLNTAAEEARKILRGERKEYGKDTNLELIVSMPRIEYFYDNDKKEAIRKEHRGMNEYEKSFTRITKLYHSLIKDLYEP